MKISIQQPEYFPWLGYFDKMLHVDKVVFLDNVQFKKRYFENRNRIRTAQGWTWIVTPVKTKGRYTQKIMEVEIDHLQKWQRRVISTIEHNYKKSPYWKEFGNELCGIVSKDYKLLVELNTSVITALMKKMGIQCQWCTASSLETKHTGSDLILEICKKTQATEYLSGASGKEYLVEKDFIAYGIKVHYQNFIHPVYKQFHGEFKPGMSIVDLYFNHGAESLNIIKSTVFK